MAWCFIATAAFAQKPTITYRAPPSGEEDRPVLTSISIRPQGNDYAISLQFNKLPWGEACKTRCANATVFLDIDNKKLTGLQLPERNAAETGSDLAITIQGTRKLKEGIATPVLLVKVDEYTQAATTVEQGNRLVELEAGPNVDQVRTSGTTVLLNLDSTLSHQLASQIMRVVYRPPASKALIGTAPGFASPVPRKKHPH